MHPLADHAGEIPGIQVDARTVQVLEESFALLVPSAAALTRAFYERLFAMHPGLRQMFPADIKVQEKKLLDTLVTVKEGLAHPGPLRQKLRELGSLHASKGVKDEQYAIVCDLLVSCMKDAGGAAWTPAYHAEWQRALAQISELMISGGRPEAAGGAGNPPRSVTA